MNDSNRKFKQITAKLKAINTIPYLLESIESQEWDFTAICRIFVETIGYNSCWIALIDDSGELKNFFQYESKTVFSFVWEKPSRLFFDEFVKEALVHPSDVIMNEDPLIGFINDSGTVEESPSSITIKLMYNNIIYGILSVTLFGDYQLMKEEFLIISDVVRTVSFFLYDMDYRNRIKNLFLTVFETTGTGTTLIEEDTVISYANQEFERLSGYTKEEIEGEMSFIQVVHEKDRDRMIQYHRLRRIDPAKAPRNYEFTFIDKAGNEKNIFLTIDIVPNTKVSIASFMDVTEKKMLESRVLKASEIERNQLAGELHDGLGPHLVGIQFMIKLIKHKVQRGSLPEVNQIEEVDSLISQAIDHTRRITKGLKPVDIQPDGLLFALNELVADIEHIYRIKCNLVCEDPVSIDNNITATHLYYIVREAVYNAVKHAKPQLIEVIIESDSGSLTLEIRDDGIGIPKMLDSEHGMGISIMQYRANIINAKISIGRNDKGGTSVTCSMIK